MITGIEWIEAWVDSSSLGNYVLILRRLVDGGFEVVDPQEQNRIVVRFDSYVDVRHWLAEEEYEQIEGRYLIEAERGLD